MKYWFLFFGRPYQLDASTRIFWRYISRKRPRISNTITLSHPVSRFSLLYHIYLKAPSTINCFMIILFSIISHDPHCYAPSVVCPTTHFACHPPPRHCWEPSCFLTLSWRPLSASLYRCTRRESRQDFGGHRERLVQAILKNAGTGQGSVLGPLLLLLLLFSLFLALRQYGVDAVPVKVEYPSVRQY